MKNFTMIIILSFLCVPKFVIGQDTGFGKVSEKELEEKEYAQDSDAKAAVLFRKVTVYFNYHQSEGFQVVTNIFERVKIYNKDGFDYATVAERLYRNRSDEETLSGLKAITYNLENGQISKDKLKNSDVFKTNINAYYDEEKFTLPNVREGSVIEYEYKLNSPFFYAMDEIALQYDIPIKQQSISIEIPEYFYFKPNMKGYLAVTPKYATSSGKINFTSKQRSEGSGFSSYKTTFQNSSINYEINETLFEMKRCTST